MIFKSMHTDCFSALAENMEQFPALSLCNLKLFADKTDLQPSKLPQMIKVTSGMSPA